jgi:phage tail-like protein
MKPVRYAFLRSGEAWPTVDAMSGLEVDVGGVLALARLHAASPQISRLASEPGFANLAIGDCLLYSVDAEAPALVRVDLVTGERLEMSWAGLGLPGLQMPAGCAVGPSGWLFVAADTKVLTFDQSLHLRAAWSGFSNACAVAANRERVYVLEAPNRIRCFDSMQNAIPTFSSSLAATSDIRGLALGADGVLFISDDTTGAVLRLDNTGAHIGQSLAKGTRPRSLAVSANRLVVGDLASSSVLEVALPSEAVLGAVSGYGGCPSGLAITADDDLVIKPGMGREIVTAEEAAAFASAGELIAGPLDAGVDNLWYRVSIRRVHSTGGDVVLSTHTASSDTTPPGSWQVAVGEDELLTRSNRFLWLRLQLAGDGRSTPRIRQIEAETPGESYIRHLPAVYGRDDAAPEFLIPFLELARSQLGDLELAVEDLPRLFDPAVAPTDTLPWLATWLAFTPPPGSENRPQLLRSLLAELPMLVRKRGTAAGMIRSVEIQAGVRPHVIEDFRGRSVFALETSSTLGFDTMLPALDPDGLVLGQAPIGASGPSSAGDWGAGLFSPFAHRFSVLVPPSSARTGLHPERVTQTVEEEKPAHTLAHVCFLEPTFKVGYQARIGLDAIVAAHPTEVSLDKTSTLGLNTRLAGPVPGSPGVAGHGQVGVDTRLG